MDDIQLAKRYLSKAERAGRADIKFTLSFMSYKNLSAAKKCGYTGLEMTAPRPGKPIRSSDRTIDRIDSTLGYVKGNVIAVCHSANKLKSVWENPNNKLTASLVKKMLDRLS